MIYQFKITLEDQSPPVWRRVLIDAGSTFYDLHLLIQVAMGWTDTHLHVFRFALDHEEVLKELNAVRGLDDANKQLLMSSLKPYEFIGDPEANDGFDELNEDLNEHDEFLSDWFFEKGNSCLYTYDFGDDWQHHIVLEKILGPVQGQVYPYCLNAKGAFIAEDSRGQDIEPEWITDEKKAVKEINDKLGKVFEEEWEIWKNNSQGDFVSQATTEEWKKLFELVNTYKKAKPWEWLEDSHIIVIQDPVTNDYMYCSVLGCGGEEFGLAMYIGDAGLSALASTLFPDPSGQLDSFQRMIQIQRSLLVSFSDRDEIEKEDYDLIKEAGFSYRGKKQWPMFRSFAPGYYPWTIDQEEVRLLIRLLPEIMRTCQEIYDRPQLLMGIPTNHFFARVLKGHGGGKDTINSEAEAGINNVQWTNSLIPFNIPLAQVNPTPMFDVNEQAEMDELLLQRLKNELDKTKTVLEFNLFDAPTPIQESPQQRPYYPLISLWVDKQTGTIIHMDVLTRKSLNQLFYNSFVELLQNLGWKPHRIQVSDQAVYSLLLPLTKTLGIYLDQLHELPALEDAQDAILEEYFHSF
ncbi:plasmid pRiA4b ORF-3 family protein [Bacillus horti]|uniref:Uncharacterized protein n=1 Tax=Caldalkalibacillus horti TaxID=77523 RepID=A0ABT9VZI6_9BACI|nr:plasmid pRiA4b ORF-3 family protein [Bacillus horti]MDQ0166396.1 hypothetical protein [Bacillus horti]